ncbi:MAG: serine hydrolase domain-containing protein [Spirosomataceae bacterium]
MKLFRIWGLVLLFSPVFAQTASKHIAPTLAVGAPELAGFSSERLARMDALLQEYVQKNRFPGVTAIVVRNGKIVYHKAFGMADKEQNIPMTKESIFRIASMTKAITSLGIMMLYEEGKIMLDDRLSKYIPEFAKPVVLDQFNAKDSTYTTVPAKREITIRHLLSHTSGINYNSIANDDRMKAIYGKAGILDMATLEPTRIIDNVRKIAKLPLSHNPGDKWTYGLSTDVLGAVIEIASGMTLSDFFEKRIFEPLGMKSTHFYLPDSQKSLLVPLYSENKDKGLVKLTAKDTGGLDPDFPIKGAKTYYSGGGGLSSTAYDYAVFLQMLLNGGTYNGKRLLSRKTVDLFTTSNQTGNLYPLPHLYFSLGFAVINELGRSNSLNSVGNFAWGGAFSTHYFADPKEKICAVLMKQMWPTSYGAELDTKFDMTIYQALDD